MPKKVRANLFKLEANLLQDGNIEMTMSAVSDKDVESILANGMPEYDGAHAVASVIRFLKSVGNEAMDKSRNYVY